MKCRKKPVVIEAVEWKGGNKSAIEIQCFIKDGTWEWICGETGTELYIPALEGKMKIKVNVGDFIIKGINGGFYPCKLDVFWKTYEVVE